MLFQNPLNPYNLEPNSSSAQIHYPKSPIKPFSTFNPITKPNNPTYPIQNPPNPLGPNPKAYPQTPIYNPKPKLIKPKI